MIQIGKKRFRKYGKTSKQRFWEEDQRNGWEGEKNVREEVGSGISVEAWLGL